MRKLIESSFVSLDGVVAAERLSPHWSDEGRALAFEELAAFDAFVLGRKTFEMFKTLWEPVRGNPYLDAIRAMPKHVATTTLKDPGWNGRVLGGDVAAAVKALKQQPGRDLLKYGSGQLDRTLLEHGLLDELRLTIFPVVLGQGPRLFEGIDVSKLKLTRTDTRAIAGGIVRVRFSVG